MFFLNLYILNYRFIKKQLIARGIFYVLIRKLIQNVPTLRFPEFSGEWTKRKIKNIFESVTRGYVLSKKDISTIKTNIFKYPVYSSQTLNNGLLGYYLNYLYENAITWTTDGANAGEVNFRRDKFYCTNVCGVLLSNNGYCNDCMAAIINKIAKKFVSFVGNPKLMNNVMENIEIIFPSNIKEQLKIASFLSLIDKRIELQNKIIRDYKLFKKGIQNYFFKNINSDNSYSLSCFLEEYTLKKLKNNLQVVSVGKYGIRQRNEIYSKVLSDDLSKNKVIFQDTLTIGMGTKQIDFGILSKNVEYCVSPAYRTYKIKNINSEYLKYYLEIINNQLSRKYMIISARQGTTIDNKSFLEHQLVVHPILKQNYIVNVINIIQKYLTISDDILKTHKDLKKYLLKHIFI